MHKLTRVYTYFELRLLSLFLSLPFYLCFSFSLSIDECLSFCIIFSLFLSLIICLLYRIFYLSVYLTAMPSPVHPLCLSLFRFPLMADHEFSMSLWYVLLSFCISVFVCMSISVALYVSALSLSLSTPLSPPSLSHLFTKCIYFLHAISFLVFFVHVGLIISDS